MRLALAQIDTVVGDLDGNRDRILARLEEAREAEADLVLFPELAVTGYPPEDLLLRPSFLRPRHEASTRSRPRRKGLPRSWARPTSTATSSTPVRSARTGEVGPSTGSASCPNYGVFDEDRYFQAGRELLLLRLGETLVGVTICEDIWQPGPPATDLALAGAHVVANVSASPFHLGKGVEREEMLATRARDNVCWVALVNSVGGQDELVFDGQSLVIDQDGCAVARRAGVRGGTRPRRHRARDGDRPPAPRRSAARAGAGAAARRSAARRPRRSAGAPGGGSPP